MTHHESFYAIDNLQDDDIIAFFERFVGHDDAAACVAIVDQETIGCVTVAVREQAESRAIKQVGAISGLMVHPDFRRQGIGRALMDTARTWLSERGLEQSTLSTAMTNEGAIRFHKRIGMTPLSMTMPGATTANASS